MNKGKASFKKTNKSSVLLASASLGRMNDSAIDMNDSNNGGFNLFTHHKKRQMEGTDSLTKDYDNLRVAVMELYLSVKIRSDEEIDAYGKDQFNAEKKELGDICAYELIDNIKTSIEVLMNMKMEGTDEDIDGRNHFQDDSGSGFNIDQPDIEIDLPPGAKAGLKDATDDDIRLNTDKMNEQLKKSLPLGK